MQKSIDDKSSNQLFNKCPLKRDIDIKFLLSTLIFIYLISPISVIASSKNTRDAQTSFGSSNIYNGNSRSNITENAKTRNLAAGLKRHNYLISKVRIKNDNGFFVHDDFCSILLDLGVNLVDNNIKQRTHWGIKGQGLAGYGHKISDETSFILGLNVPYYKIDNENSGNISLSIGSWW